MIKEHASILDSLILNKRTTKEELKTFSDQELEQLAIITLEYVKAGESLTLKKITDTDYLFKVPDIQTFVEDPHYLGSELGYPVDENGIKIVGEQRQIYDFWLDRLDDVYHKGITYDEVLITGGIGLGKTTFMNIIQTYDFIKLMSLKQPQRHYGLMPSTTIVFAFFNILKDLAEDVGYSQFQGMLESSPFFNSIMQKNKRMKAGFQMQPNKLKKTKFVIGSRISHTLGIAVFSAQMDEANFGQDTADAKMSEKKSQVYENYTSLLMRRESRFLHAPGHFCMGSSKQDSASFLEKHIEDSKGKKGVLVIDAPQYEVKACRKELYSGITFDLLLGDITRDPKILADKEVVKPELTSQIRHIPVEHKKRYEADIIGALRDISGVAASPKQAFILKKEIIRKIVSTSKRKSPWKYTSRGKVIPNTVNISFYGGDQIQDYLIKDRLFYNKGKLAYPNSNRYLAVDTGYAEDAIGISLGCKAGAKVLITDTGEKQFIDKYHTDFYIRIKGKGGEHFPLYKITEFIKYLINVLKIPIAGVTTDGFQSVQLRQDVKIAFPYLDVELLSADKDDSTYINLRDIFYTDTMEGMYPDTNILVECFDLVHLTTGARGTIGNMRKMIVDHPVIASDKFVGRKDVMDSLSCMITSCKAGDTSVSFEELKSQTEEMKNTDLDTILKDVDTTVDEAMLEIDKLNIDDLFKGGE